MGCSLEQSVCSQQLPPHPISSAPLSAWLAGPVAWCPPRARQQRPPVRSPVSSLVSVGDGGGGVSALDLRGFPVASETDSLSPAQDKPHEIPDQPLPSPGRSFYFHENTRVPWTTSRDKKVEVKSFSRVQLSVTPWTVAHQAPPSLGFSRQEYWSGLPFRSPGDLPNPGIEPRSPAPRADTSPSESPGKPTSGGGKYFLDDSVSQVRLVCLRA